MCTVVVLRRPGEAWPLIVAGNRDELLDRPRREPARHWPDRPEVVAGLDQLAGRSWPGLNAHAVAAALLNRRHSPGPAPAKPTRRNIVPPHPHLADPPDAADPCQPLDSSASHDFHTRTPH